jgi:HEAT repeat protein
MERLLWLLGLAAAFGLGWAAGGSTTPPAPREVERLQQQVTTLQARLAAREEAAASRPADVRRAAAASPREERSLADFRTFSSGPAPRRGALAGDRGTARAGSPAPAPTIDGALDRFHRYLEAITSSGGRERWQRARELVEELREMGDVAGKALMQVLASATDSDERRAAARLLGQLQVPESLPLLRDIIEKDPDVLLRRAAAVGLRQLQTPESIPVMEHMLANPGDDRMVRLSAAYGLAEAGRASGVNGLAQIFVESTADGRGRDLAFRALASLNDERALPFMRQVVASGVEPTYRLRAIQYVAAQGDQQALATLQVVMSSPTEQPSIRDAARQAYRALGGK